MEQRPEPESETPVARIADEVRRIVDREMGIAREELQEKATAVAADALLVGAAGVLGYAALLAFLAAAVDAARGAEPRRPVWQGAVLVGTGLVTASAALGAAGLTRFRRRTGTASPITPP